ncbi:hypothetical protein GDO81_020234, partial [Engystomops pustulosus]
APKNVQIKAKSNIIKIIEGDNITLECSVESSNPSNFNIKWYKNKRFLEVMKSKATIPVSEAGSYYCEAGNIVGSSTSNTVRVSVLYPPKYVSIKTPPGNIIEGRPFALSCSADAVPPVSRYFWYKNGVMSIGYTGNRYSFSSVKEKDSGSYECEAFNERGSDRSPPVQVDVKYAPKNVKMIITPKGKQFREGTNVTFECIVNSSNPEVRNIAWFKDDKKLFVEKKAITEKDAGKYRCEAENEIGKSSSNEVVVEVLFLPKVSKPTISNDNKNKEDEEATVKCTSIEGNPKISSYDWFKDGKPYKTTERDSLYFSKLSWTDAGYYSCKARNTIGSSEESLRQYLVVQYAPKNVTVQVSPGPSVTQNTNVQLNCTAKGNAGYLHYTWYYKDEPLQNSNKDHVIRNIQVSQAGEYYCYVRNDIGSNTSPVLHLHVSHSALTKVMYTAAGIGPLIVLVIAVVIILHFRVWLKNCRKTNNDQSDASFFVLKKAHNEASDPQQSSSEDSLNQHINYASLQFPASSNGGQDQSRIKTNSSDPSDIYSVVRKPRSAAEVRSPLMGDQACSHSYIH